MSCNRCDELMVPFLIRTPGELGKAVRVVQANLTDGTLEQVEAGDVSSKPQFRDLREEGPWDDVLSYRFQCRECGQSFSLTAETYHGGGGEWTPHNSRPEADRKRIMKVPGRRT
jgi:hypothetical protein